jgi:hypothetical protein
VSIWEAGHELFAILEVASDSCRTLLPNHIIFRYRLLVWHRSLVNTNQQKRRSFFALGCVGTDKNLAMNLDPKNLRERRPPAPFPVDPCFRPSFPRPHHGPVPTNSFRRPRPMPTPISRRRTKSSRLRPLPPKCFRRLRPVPAPIFRPSRPPAPIWWPRQFTESRPPGELERLVQEEEEELQYPES